MRPAKSRPRRVRGLSRSAIRLAEKYAMTWDPRFQRPCPARESEGVAR